MKTVNKYLIHKNDQNHINNNFSNLRELILRISFKKKYQILMFLGRSLGIVHSRIKMVLYS